MKVSGLYPWSPSSACSAQSTQQATSQRTLGAESASSRRYRRAFGVPCEAPNRVVGGEHEPSIGEPMIREQLGDALKTATEAHDQCTTGVVRLILAALKERDDQARSEGLSDAEVIALLQAMIDQRCDSGRRYEEGGQLELAQSEAAEIEVIKRFLPAKLDDEASANAIHQVITELGACKLKDAGRVMTELKSRYPNRMDFGRARRMICRQLA